MRKLIVFVRIYGHVVIKFADKFETKSHLQIGNKFRQIRKNPNSVSGEFSEILDLFNANKRIIWT